jgi:putative restriction endonuclease
MNGPDDPRNVISLCRLHHWAFDNGLFSIRKDYTIIVNEQIKKDINYKEIYNFENKKNQPSTNSKSLA